MRPRPLAELDPLNFGSWRSVEMLVFCKKSIGPKALPNVRKAVKGFGALGCEAESNRH